MELSETKELLIYCLNRMKLQRDTKIAIALMLKSENQMLTMLDWIKKHHMENPQEDFVLRIAIAISEKVQ